MPAKLNYPSLAYAELFGCTQAHLSPVAGQQGVFMHKAVEAPLMQLAKAASDAGFDLRIASGFRSFERQRLIWNEKCVGLRTIFDRNGKPLVHASLSVLEKIEAILHWSALPGASRHHWGSECDIYDAAAMPADYRLQLHPSEYLSGGLFHPMMQWLEEYLKTPDGSGFYRPYFSSKTQSVLSESATYGVAQEPWHLSYRPVADGYASRLSCSSLKEYLQQLSSDHRIEDQEVVINHLESIFERYILLGD